MSAPKTHWDRASHFIGVANCRFGMTDVAGGHIISTVGDWRPPHTGRIERIGCDRFYETMVFRDSWKRCEIADCDCGGLPQPADWTSVDFDGYQTANQAHVGHAAMVEKCHALKPGEP